jgi:hypothetical protein
MANRFAGEIGRLLDSAGIRIDGGSPWDFQVRDQRVFRRILAQGALGLGESYWIDRHNFGADYDRTLMAWFHKFDGNWPRLRDKYGGERFYRMWKYYLLSCAGGFRARAIQLWQIVLSKHGVPGGYVSVR